MSESTGFVRPVASIRTDGSNAFAEHSMRVRVPEILARCIAESKSAPQSILDGLKALCDDVSRDAPLRTLTLPAPDSESWELEVERRAGERWFATDWFFAETYLYRRVIEAARFFETAVDPFRAIKVNEDLSRPKTRERVELAREISARKTEEALAALLDAVLWGNRIDLSYAAAASHGTLSSDADRLLDHRSRALPALLRAGARVDVVLDNAGTELLLDLVLAAHLLERHPQNRVVLHVKSHPTFVSDAIAVDAREALVALGGVLPEAFALGRLRIVPDAYWNSPTFIDAAPRRIVGTLADADLVIVKGDANYRRWVGDADWDPVTEPESATGPLPFDTLALRTLKSDPIVGLPAGLAARLTAESASWRFDGKRGIAQFFARATR